MASVKLTKNELKNQKDKLKQFERYLPTLQLKKQQLQSVITKVSLDIEAKKAELAAVVGDLDDWIAVYGENALFEPEKRIENLVQPEYALCEQENIAGVNVPVFRELTFRKIEYDIADYPLWVDTALIRLREIARLQMLIRTLQKQIDLLAAELRSTSQRVNLFEKVKIPQTRENIRIIGIYLGDQQTSAVVRGKIAKSKHQGADT